MGTAIAFHLAMSGSAQKADGEMERNFHYAAKYRQTVIFHGLAVALIASNGVFGGGFGYWGQVLACSITTLALTLNLLHGLYRPRTYYSFAAVGLGIALLHLSFIAALMPELPILMAYFIFAPILAVILLGEKYVKRWSYFTIGALVLAVGLSQLGLGHVWRGSMSSAQLLFVNLFTLGSMMALAMMTIMLLLEDHREFVGKMTEQQVFLAGMNRRLVALQSSKERFFATASHELRTPMNAIAGICELLRSSRQDKAEVDNLLVGLHNSSRHLLSIINDLLDLGKLRENKLQLAIADFDVRDAINVAFGIARDAQRAKNNAVKMELFLAPGLPQYVRGDARRLMQVLLNLLNNATKFTPAGDISLQVRISAATEPNSCRMNIRLSDTGIGMSSATLNTLFDDYVQANESIAATYGGTGLGLSITKRLVDLMSGNIEVASELGRGSIFKVDIEMPLGTAPVKLETAAPVNDPVIGKRILIVDDNQLNVVIAQKLIERKFPGIVIDSAQNGQIAVDKVTTQFYDLIFMDMQMPVLNGVEATKQIRLLRDARQALVPIVAMTANTEDADVAACLDAGMNQTMSKPVSAGALAAVVQEFLFLDPTKSCMNIRVANSGDFYVPLADSETGN